MKPQTKNKDSERDFSSDSHYDRVANETPFVGDDKQTFQFEDIFTAAEIQTKKDLAGTSVIVSEVALHQIK